MCFSFLRFWSSWDYWPAPLGSAAEGYWKGRRHLDWRDITRESWRRADWSRGDPDTDAEIERPLLQGRRPEIKCVKRETSCQDPEGGHLALL